jgi:hypothetical protein
VLAWAAVIGQPSYHEDSMHIDSFSFGRIVVDGTEYRRDLILLPDRVEHPWWREAGGHVFAPRDLGPLLEVPDLAVAVLGIGAHGCVQVPPETHRAFAGREIELVVRRTPEAVARFNELQAAGRSVAAGLHLTC